MCSGTYGGGETSLNEVAHDNIRVYYIYEGVCENFLKISLNYFKKLSSGLFEACSASIAARATDLFGIYESDNGRKEE